MTKNNQHTKFEFDPIAGRYDGCNQLFSLGMDSYWRRKLVRALHPGEKHRVLDLCCGTGDVVFAMLRHSPVREVTGLDLCESMLHVAQEKQMFYSGKTWMQDRKITWTCGDAVAMSYDAGTFDFVTCAFGIRNITDRTAALVEMHRVLKPSGWIGVLEFSLPSSRLFRSIYLFYLVRLMPFAGRLVLKDRRPLDYLAASIRQWHENVNFAQELTLSGFKNIQRRALVLGAVTLWLAKKNV